MGFCDTVDFEVVTAVHQSWDKVKRIKNHQQIAGELLFRKIFELAPGALNMYSFGPEYLGNEETLYQSIAFKKHAAGVVNMLNEAVNMLGPDLGPVLEELTKLGARHVAYGVLPAHYGIVGQALLATLETALGDGWTPLVQKGWTQVYGFVSTAMIAGADSLVEAKRRRRERREQKKRAEAKAGGSVRDLKKSVSPASPRRRRIPASPRKEQRDPAAAAAHLAKISCVRNNQGENSRPTQEDISKVLQDALCIADDETVSDQSSATSETENMDDVVYSQVVDVVDSTWAKIKRIPNYEEVAGVLLFRKIFEIAPPAKGLFEFTNGFAEDDDALYSSPGFLAHAKRVVSMLDVAVNMLGPDLEPVTYALEELGKRHVRYGVIPDHYPIVGQALLSTLEAALGEAWTPTVKEGWSAIYAFVSMTMIKGANQCSSTKQSTIATTSDVPRELHAQFEVA